MKVLRFLAILFVGYALVVWQASIFTGDSRFIAMSASVTPVAWSVGVLYLCSLGWKTLFD